MLRRRVEPGEERPPGGGSLARGRAPIGVRPPTWTGGGGGDGAREGREAEEADRAPPARPTAGL